MDRTRTNSGRGRGTRRGQTLHDYVVGISVFIIATGLVLGLLPGVIAPYQGEGTAVDSLTAKHIADTVVANLSLDGAPNTLDSSNLTALTSLNLVGLRSRYGVGNDTYVNLTLTDLRRETIHMAAGASAESENTNRAGRLVRTTVSGLCEPACRLTVRVW